MMRVVFAGLVSCLWLPLAAAAADGNRLAYLDGPLDPYYPHRDFPKLITPQWVGEEGVECVVTLAIDDMRESAKYEAYLRPILNRLKQIDGRAAVSIMSCRVDPADPQLQAWLKEGVSIECHSYDHPCPILQDGGLEKAKGTYDKCVDLMNQIPGNKPVAFRVPCCDSKNTPSPRFWAEIFNKTTEKGNFLQIDSSVFNIITNKDKELPTEITELPDGSERFRRYVPFANFVNTIEDYPYPYIIGGMCWEFPCVTPSDWSAQHVQKPNNPDTVRDWKLALDACVIKQGTFNLVFHPHGWIKAEQIVELIDHAVTKHGKKVKFLTFKECAERLNANVFAAGSIRSAVSTLSRAILLDFNSDGFLDVEASMNEARIWEPTARIWKKAKQGVQLRPAGESPLAEVFAMANILDLDGDGRDEAIFAGAAQSYSIVRDPKAVFEKLAFKLPSSIPAGLISQWIQTDKDIGLRLIDINADRKLDCLFSSHERYSLHLFKDMKEGWSIKVFDVLRGQEDNKAPVIPPFARADGTNNGAWFHSGALWLMNEDTWNPKRFPDHVFKLTFAEMLGKPQASGGREPAEAKQGDDCCESVHTSDDRASNNQASGGRKLAEVKKGQAANNASNATVPKEATQNSTTAPNLTSGDLRSPLAKSAAVAPSSDARYDDLAMPPPLSPEDSLKALHVRPGMKVELVAAEPLIVDPVAFDWGPDGRLWVVEMRDYPSGITWNKEGDEFGKPGGRVKVLTDVDGDGRYDKAVLFLDELPFPTGVKVWRKGILVTAAPDILYAEDTDSDDKADIKTTLYRGFGEGNQQHRVNGLRWGLDNWLHVGNGDSGGVIRSLTAGLLAGGQGTGDRGQGNSPPLTTHYSPNTPRAEVNVNGRDLRIRPDSGELDATSGNTQFGRERDDWGNWFGNNNSNPLWHYTLDDFYLRRNPHLTPPSVKKDVSVVPGAAPVYPRSKTLARFNDDNKANRYTSACGPMIYRDDLLGPEYYGNVFVCEPVHNLVSREIISPQGSTFTSKRAADEQKSEFLASEDNWFRPSMVRTGPDGAVWVADMYRFVIEHPKWIPLAAQKKLDLRAGDDKGRIYRIYPEGKKPRPIARLDKLDTAGLVAALDSPNGQQRDLAHQMLLWRKDTAAADPLARLAAECKRPQARQQALCTLDGLDALTDEILLKALADEAPSVRRHGLRLSESRLSKSPALATAALKLVNDGDIQVRIQLAYSLGSWAGEQSAVALARLLFRGNGDPYVEAAVLSSVSNDNVGTVISAVRTERNRPIDPSDLDGLGLVIFADRATDRLLGMAIAMGQETVVGPLLATMIKPDRRGRIVYPYGTLTAVLDAVQRRNLKLQDVLGDDYQQLVPPLLEHARQVVAAANDRNSYYAISAMPFLARGLDDRDADDVQLLGATLSPHKPPAVCKAVIEALARTGRSEVPALLLANWSARSPALRSQILDVLSAREAWSLALLAAVESGQVPQSQFDARRRQQFLTARSSAVREKAEKTFAAAANPDRQKLIETYLAAATSNTGEHTRGQVAFTKRCANCHRLAGQGHNVGPDLSPLTQRPLDYLLTQILDPNRAVEDRYLEYVALTTDGQQLAGILTEDSSNSILLIGPEGKYQRFRRTDLEQIKSSGKSLMPEGIERDVPPAEMADILAYLKTNAPPPKQLALNQPEVVLPFNDGSIRMFATNCRAYGPTIKMEETFRALGWWNSTDDYCAWTFEVLPGTAGEYRVTLDYSCADNSAGNHVVVEVAGQALSGQVASSGGWDRFRGWNLGTVKLPEGQSEIVVRSSGPIKNALFDLGGIRLVPTK